MSEGKTPVVEKVVFAESLERCTSEGWEVVERLDHDGPIVYTCDEVLGSNTYPSRIQKMQIGRVVSFRVRQPAASLLAELHARISALELARRNAVSEANESAKKLVAEVAGHMETAASLAKERAQTDRIVSDLRRVETARSALEVDIGKLRDHIGRREFEKIIPPTPKADS